MPARVTFLCTGVCAFFVVMPSLLSSPNFGLSGALRVCRVHERSSRCLPEQLVPAETGMSTMSSQSTMRHRLFELMTRVAYWHGSENALGGRGGLQPIMHEALSMMCKICRTHHSPLVVLCTRVACLLLGLLLGLYPTTDHGCDHRVAGLPGGRDAGARR